MSLSSAHTRRLDRVSMRAVRPTWCTPAARGTNELLRILHVVTAVTPGNRFGGPSQVAADIASAQAQAGASTAIMAAGLDFDVLPRTWQGIPVLLRHGHVLAQTHPWATLISLTLFAPAVRAVRSSDIVHIHLARDLITIPVALMSIALRKPFLVQTHGMFGGNPSNGTRLFDRILTRTVLSSAREILALSTEEQRVLERIAGRAATVRLLANAAPSIAISKHIENRVLFLARLHPRKGAVDFARAVRKVRSNHRGTEFLIVGPDEGDATAVDFEIARAREEEPELAFRYIGGVTPATARALLASCLIYVLPAQNEPFGMTVVEAMAAGRPVIVHETAALASEILRAGAGWTFDDRSPGKSLSDVLEYVLSTPDQISEAGKKAARLTESRYSMSSLIGDLQDAYQRSLDHDG